MKDRQNPLTPDNPSKPDIWPVKAMKKFDEFSRLQQIESEERTTKWQRRGEQRRKGREERQQQAELGQELKEQTLREVGNPIQKLYYGVVKPVARTTRLVIDTTRNLMEVLRQ